MPTASLIAPRWRGTGLGAIAVAVAVTTWLAVISYDSGGTAFDRWAARTAFHHVGAGTASVLLDISSPGLAFGLVFLVAAAAFALRRWELVLLAAIGPIVAVLLTEQVLKPLIGRLIGINQLTGDLTNAFVGAFPSGHETGVTSAATVLLVAAGQVRLRPVARAVVVGALALWVVLAAIGLVANRFHYATDTIGAVGLSVATVLAVALALDRWYLPLARRLADRRRRSAQLTERS